MNFAVKTSNEFARLRDEVARGANVVSLHGLTSVSAKAFVLAQLRIETKQNFVVVTDTNKDLETWNCDLSFFLENSEAAEILALPSFETDVYSGISPHAETQEDRALTLWRLLSATPAFLIVSAKSLVTKTLAPDELRKLGAELKRDEDFSPDELIETLAASGYVREDPIKNVGEFSVRGGILDVWSPAADNPVRIEFFGDTVDSIREFDAETQLSIGQLKEVTVAPMREFAATAKDFKDWAFFARELFADERFARNLKDRTDFADEGEDFGGWEFLIASVLPRRADIFAYLKNSVFVIDEPTVIEHALENFYETSARRYAETLEADDIALAPAELFLEGEELRRKLGSFRRIDLRALGRTAAATDDEFQIS